MRRRHLALAGAGIAAAAAGAAWRLQQPGDASASADADATAALWAMRFERPEGGELVMADFRGRPLVLNFWATWCPPCLKEMPALDRFQQRFARQGWQVVGLAVDGPTPVRAYLQRTPVRFAIGMAGLEGTALSRRLGNQQGALPFTAVFDGRGMLRHRKLGETSDAELGQWAQSAPP